MVRILTLFLVASLALLGAAGPAQSAKKMPKRPKVPKVTSYWAKVEISGAVRISSLYDTLDSCLPGQAWRLTERANVILKGNTIVSVVRGRVSVGLIQNKQSIRQESDLGGYRTTNYCEGPKAELKKPDCRPEVTGNGQAFMQTYPGSRKRVVVLIKRTSGANQDSSCFIDPVDTDSLYASIHAFQWKRHHLTFPLQMDQVGFHKMKPGWKHRTRINVNGACDDAKLTTPESDWVTKQAIAAESCSVSANFRVTITRANPKKAKGKTARKAR